MSTFIKGDDVILSIYDGSAYKPVGCLTSNDISFTRNVIEAQTKCNPGVIVKQAGSTSSEISFEATYIVTDAGKTSFDELLQFINVINGTTQTWKMTSAQSSPVAYYGSAILADLSLSSAAGDEFASFSGTLSNSGLIVTVDPNA